MRDGAILSNAGHFDVEIDVKSIMDEAKSVKQVRPNTDEITLPGGKRVYLLGKGRIVNLVAAEGHPPEVMQMSFANQFMSALYVYKNHSKLQEQGPRRAPRDRGGGGHVDPALSRHHDRQGDEGAAEVRRELGS